MLKPGGYATVTEADGSVRERDTFTCAHGNEIVPIPPGRDPLTIGQFCRCCMKQICEKCAAEMNRTLRCIPFEKRLEKMESREKFRKALTG